MCFDWCKSKGKQPKENAGAPINSSHTPTPVHTPGPGSGLRPANPLHPDIYRNGGKRKSSSEPGKKHVLNAKTTNVSSPSLPKINQLPQVNLGSDDTQVPHGNTTYVPSPSPHKINQLPQVNLGADGTQAKQPNKTSTPETKNVSSPLSNSTDQFLDPKADSGDSTAGKMGETKQRSPLPSPEKLMPTSIDENNTHRFSTSDEVAHHHTTEFPTSAHGEQNTITAQQNFVNTQQEVLLEVMKH